MKFQFLLMKHGIGSPGYIAKTMTRQYRLIRESRPELDEQTVLHRVYVNRIGAQTTFGGPEIYKMSRRDPDLIHRAVAENPHLFLIIKHAVLIGHPEFQNPKAPSNRFEVLNRVIAEVIERETRDWAGRPSMMPPKPRSSEQTIKAYDADPQLLVQQKGIRPEGGDSVEQALSTFLRACKEPGTLFITEEWVQPHLQSLEFLLSDPITSEQAEALRDAIEKRAKLNYVIDWLSGSILPWRIFLERREECERQLKILEESEKRIKHEQAYWKQQLALRTRAETDWEAQMRDSACQAGHDLSAALEKYRKLAHACSQCGSTNLKWFYYKSPIPHPDSKLARGFPDSIHGFAGWMTACEICRVKVDFFQERRIYFRFRS